MPASAAPSGKGAYSSSLTGVHADGHMKISGCTQSRPHDPHRRTDHPAQAGSAAGVHADNLPRASEALGTRAVHSVLRALHSRRGHALCAAPA